MLSSCTLCPRSCKVNRLQGELGFCRAGAETKIARAALHHWEEPPISGTRGSGTVFFSHCNLRCIFCQNHPISQGGYGKEVSVETLAHIFLNLQTEGAHNINLVSPTHYIPQIVEALRLAKKLGLFLPVVYNSNGYESVEAVRSLEGLIDVYLPDLKYAGDDASLLYSSAPGYFAAATAAIREMFRQVGEPVFAEDGLIRRGLIIRHLILPGRVKEAKKVLSWIKENLPPGVYVSLMAQYFPTHRAIDCPQINRRITKREYQAVIEYFFSLGLENAFIQELTAAREKYVPPFDLTGVL